jgi:hypothetical protein
MVAGKDFTTQVFPSKTIDIGFSNMTAHIIPKAPCPRDDNVFFLINEEIKETEVGQQWVEAFKKHWTSFVSSREKELKPNG